MFIRVMSLWLSGLLLFLKLYPKLTPLFSIFLRFFLFVQLLGGRLLLTNSVLPCDISFRIFAQVIFLCLIFIGSFSMVACLYQLYLFFKYSFLMISSAVSLPLGSTTRHFSIISRIPLGHSRSCSYFPSRTFCFSSAKSLPEKGCVKVTISQSRQPKAQISAAVEQGNSSHISGLVQKGVPILVLAMPLRLIALTFISPSLTRSPSPRKKLAALTSRWMIFIRCSAASPFAISRAYTHSSSSLKAARCFRRRIMNCRKSPCSASSVTRHSCYPSKKASLYWMMLGWTILDSMRTSFRQLLLSVGPSWVRRILLRAYILSSGLRRTRKTLEKAPSPIPSRIQKSCITDISISGWNAHHHLPKQKHPPSLPLARRSSRRSLSKVEAI